MTDWSIGGGGQQFEGDGVNLASSRGNTLTSAVTNDTKGSWNQIVAATGLEAEWLLISVQHPSSAGSWLIDIGIGAGGSEKVLIPNLFYGGKSNTGVSNSGHALIAVPIHIPAGSRLSARAAVHGTSPPYNIDITLTPIGGPGTLQTCHYADDLATDAVNTLGKAIVPSGTPNTKGSYTQLIAATARDYRWVLLMLHSESGSNGSDTLIDLAVGGAGSEQVKVPNVYIEGQGVANAAGQTVLLPLYIPAGSRVAARCAGSGTPITIDAQLIGLG